MNGFEGMGTSEPMLAGLTKPSASMFSRIMPDFTPDAEEMDREAQRAQFDKSAAFAGVHANTYDLSKPKQVKLYEKLMVDIFAGLQARTHVILFSERKFVSEGEPRWVAHIEWAEFKLKKTPVVPIKGAAGETNGKESAS